MVGVGQFHTHELPIVPRDHAEFGGALAGTARAVTVPVMTRNYLTFPVRMWQQRRARRLRGRAGEERVAAVLDELAAEYRLRVHHAVPLTTRRGRRGDLDHALVVGWPPYYIVSIETKAERPRPEHLAQVSINAQRASRRHFGGAPQYRIVVHPNSNESITYDAHTRAARMGLPRLPGYLRSLLQGDHRDRLAS